MRMPCECRRGESESNLGVTVPDKEGCCEKASLGIRCWHGVLKEGRKPAMGKWVLFVRQPLDSSPNIPRPRWPRGSPPSPVPLLSSACVHDPRDPHPCPPATQPRSGFDTPAAASVVRQCFPHVCSCQLPLCLSVSVFQFSLFCKDTSYTTTHSNHGFFT